MLNLSDEWKGYFPITAVFKPPLLKTESLETGPLHFSPKPQTIQQLIALPSLSPPILSPPPSLSLPRFITTSSTTLPSTSTAILRGTEFPLHDAASRLVFNRLAVLMLRSAKVLILFFPVNDNADQLGFLILTVVDGVLCVQGCDFFSAGNRLNHRIVKILVSEFEDSDSGFAFLLVCTMYSVHWYRVDVKAEESEEVQVRLKYLGCRVFKSYGIVGACWSPHLYEECLVLLENGELVLYDVSSWRDGGGCKGTRFRVNWDDAEVVGAAREWLGCEFSFHPRVFVVACSDGAYMIDFRFRECEVTCFAEVGMSKTYAKVEKDRFVTFCKTDSEGYCYALATGHLLLLCDVRKPLVPLLQWGHCLRSPCYIDVLKLSDLRANSTNDRFSWASEAGFGIVLGSFWDCEFSLFCFGPSSPSSGVDSEFSKLCKSRYAWGLPTELSLSGRECGCGTCSVREEFSKELLPLWIDWQTKKEIVLGFGILSKDLTVLLSEPDDCGGFTLVRLMSSGKLESQKYGALWEFVTRSEEVHGKIDLLSEDNYLYDIVDDKYRFTRKFRYYKFDYLHSYLNGNLPQLLESKMKKGDMCPQDDEAFSEEVHEILCEKLKACGFGRLRSSPAIALVFDDVSMPTSIHEVALRKMWAELPMDLLQLAFSNHYEFLKIHLDSKEIPLEFSIVPELCQLPPFLLKGPSCRSNRWSQKNPCDKSNIVVGPALPLPVLLTIHELRNGCPDSEVEVDNFSVEKEYNEVLQVASDMAASDSGTEQHSGHCASLADSGEDRWKDSQKEKPFVIYHPCAVVERPNDDQYNTLCIEERYIATIFRKSKSMPNSNTASIGPELFDDLCPIDLKFKATTNFSPKQLKHFNMLKRQFSEWQESVPRYKNFREQYNLQKEVS